MPKPIIGHLRIGDGPPIAFTSFSICRQDDVPRRADEDIRYLAAFSGSFTTTIEWDMIPATPTPLDLIAADLAARRWAAHLAHWTRPGVRFADALRGVERH